MKTKEEFIDQWTDELSGLLLSAFSLIPEQDTGNHYPAKYGRFMLQTMKRTGKLLERMSDDIREPATMQELCDQIIKLYALAPTDEQKRITEKLRTGFGSVNKNTIQISKTA